MAIEEFPIPAPRLAELLRAIRAGELDNSRGRDVFQVMLDQGLPAGEAMRSLGIEQVDQSALTDLCRRLLEANPGIVKDVQDGKAKAVGALIGQAKRENPNANPGQVREICLQLIAEM
jgi:aspartyl-tRNA(Asn)/glutamyl-tRNA(Gln) amidotransferase subunit B